MAFCTKCGAQVADGAGYCAQCGQPLGESRQPSPSAPAAGQTGLAENVAGLLCYAIGWITGLVFFLIDKRPFVRFHAAQSMVVFGGLHVMSWVLGWIFFAGFTFGGWGGFSLGALLIGLVNAATLVLWILLMVKAYQGEQFRIPVAADIATSLVGKPLGS